MQIKTYCQLSFVCFVFFRKVNSYKNYKIYLFVAIFALIILLFQDKKLFYMHFFNLNKKTSITKEKAKIENLISQNAELQHKLEKLSKYDEIYNALHKTNKIKSLLDVKYVKLNLENKYIIASTNQDTALNDVVVDKSGFLIGRIIAKNKNIVKILPIDSKTSSIPVISSDGITGIMHGVGRKHCECEFITLDNKTPENNALVTTSGIESLVQGGIIVGRTNIKRNKICVDLYRNNDFLSLAVLDSALPDFK